MDVNNELFRPYCYKKAGVFARQCEEEMQEVLSADPIGLNEIEFVFKSPWRDKQQNVVMCQLSENDYLALNEPLEKEDGTFEYPDGEVYRVEGAAFESNANEQEGAVVRYYQICNETRVRVEPRLRETGLMPDGTAPKEAPLNAGQWK